MKIGSTIRYPKRRIARKVEQPEYRERYEALCRRRGEVASYNTHGLLCCVYRPLEECNEDEARSA